MCVIKEVNLGPLTAQERQEAWNETSILQNLEPYPNVIDYFDAHLDPEGEKLSLVIEYADSGDLAAHVLGRRALLDEQNNAHEVSSRALPGNQSSRRESPFFQEKHIMLVFVQCLFGLHHLHKNSIMHRDIKTHNILLFSSGLVKLGDFGVAKSFKRTKVRKSYVGSPLYMAPEVHSSQGYTYKADIWSLGCVLYELCCLKHPYTGNNVIQLAMEVTNAPPPTCLDVPPHTYTVDLLHLINRMLQKDPDLRPSTAEIIRMPFVYKYSKLLTKRYRVLRHFNQIHEEFKGTLRDLPPASPCLDAANMRGKDTDVKTVTEEELFALVREAVPAGEFEHTQEQGESPEERLKTAEKLHDIQCGTTGPGNIGEGTGATVEASADLPWKSPATLEPNTFGGTHVDDMDLLIPESPLKPTDPQPNQNALACERELFFLLDALVPNGGPASGHTGNPIRQESSVRGHATENAPSFKKTASLNNGSPQPTVQVNGHSEFASNTHAQENQQAVTAEAHVMQPVNKVTSSDPSQTPSRSRPDKPICTPSRESQQPAALAKECASRAPCGRTGQPKATCFSALLCCGGCSERKCCKRKEGGATVEHPSNACSTVDAGSGAPRSMNGKITSILCCRRSKACPTLG
ncbi:NEK kinase, putative [Eimeria brunetti]|uniref:non-specific serine/threonine protein kinase n=1 Tax=Eimeria brunetti TaxID=51314 RepID=U6M0R9_9EIME|nr:NEK kinase, putative [Eimeria brunetti]